MGGEETTASSKAAAPATIRLVNFISEDQLDEAKRTRGERVDDGTAQRDKPLFQILQENKEKKDAEFNERFKHRPPKALDEDETEFLDKLASSRREYEQQVANEEAEQLRSFHEAVAAQANIVHELETPTVSRPEESKSKPPTKRSQPALLKNIIISVKPQAKKARVDAEDKPFPKSVKPQAKKARVDGEDKPAPKEVSSNGNGADQEPADDTKGALGSLVAYGDDGSESGSDDD